MANTDAIRDANRVTVGLANSSTGTRPLFIDPVTGRLEVELYAVMSGGSLNLNRALHDANHVATMTGLSDSTDVSVVDEYGVSNFTASFTEVFQSLNKAQSFSNTIPGTLDRCVFYIRKIGSPTGNVFAEIYAHSGVYGTSSIPTGPILATSEPLDISTLTTSFQLITFNFLGTNRIALSANTFYEVVLSYASGDVSNALRAAVDTTSPTFPGNPALLSGGIWTPSTTFDLIFYVYRDVSGYPMLLAAAVNAGNGFLSVDLLQE